MGRKVILLFLMSLIPGIIVSSALFIRAWYYDAKTQSFRKVVSVLLAVSADFGCL